MRFDDFVVEHGPALLRFAYLLTRDGALAEDLVQESLIRAHRKWGSATHPEARKINELLVTFLTGLAGYDTGYPDPRAIR